MRNHSRIALLVATVALATAVMTATGLAQFRSGIQVVPLTVTVSNRAGGYVPDLSPSDFMIFEDGKPQTLSLFAAVSSPIDLALVLDNSSSMTEDFHSAQEAACGLTRRLKPGDRAALSGTVRNTFNAHPMTADLRRIDSAIRLMQVFGSTAIYDATYILLRQLQREGRIATEGRRQVIVLLSDGVDNASHVDGEELLDSVRRSDVAVYVILLGDEIREAIGGKGRAGATQAWFAMNALARESGGRMFTPHSASELPAIYDAIALELSNQYLIGYTPQRQDADGKFRRISVRVQHPEVAQARTRAGYYALPRRAAFFAPSGSN